MPKRTSDLPCGRPAFARLALAGLILAFGAGLAGARQASAQSRAPLPQAPSVFESASFQRAKAMSEEQGKILYVYGVKPDCADCRKMDAEVFTNPRVVAWLEDNAICVRVDGEDGSPESVSLHFGPYPGHIFIKDKQIVDRVDGALTSSEFLSLAKGAMRGRTTSERVEEEYRRALRNGFERNVDVRYSFALKLLDAKNYPAATEEFTYLWQNAAKLDPRYARARFDEAGLGGKIKDLVAAYPPARETFTKLRDDLTPRVDPALGADKISAADVQDWVALNVILRDSPTLIEWATNIADNGDHAILEKGGEPLFDALCTRAQWPLMGYVFPDPLIYVNECRRRYAGALDQSPMAVASLMDKIAEVYAACLAQDRVQDALQISEAAVEVGGKAMAYDRLREKARVAGIPEEKREVWYYAGPDDSQP